MYLYQITQPKQLKQYGYTVEKQLNQLLNGLKCVCRAGTWKYFCLSPIFTAEMLYSFMTQDPKKFTYRNKLACYKLSWKNIFLIKHSSYLQINLRFSKFHDLSNTLLNYNSNIRRDLTLTFRIQKHQRQSYLTEIYLKL